jgi:hypothetical protein
MSALTAPRALPSRTALAALVLAVAPAAQAASTLYDSFANPIIDPGRWAAEADAFQGAVMVEGRRAVQSHALRLEVKGYGDMASFSGNGLVRNRMVMTDAAGVTQLKATITPRTMNEAACPRNQVMTAGRSSMSVYGTFFNTGTTTPASRRNDIVSGVEITRFPGEAAGHLSVYGFVDQCLDDSCSEVKRQWVSNFANATMDTPLTVQVTWSQAQGQFSWSADTHTASTSDMLHGRAPPAPFDGAKGVQVTSYVPNCMSPRAFSYTGADFTNIFTNP